MSVRSAGKTIKEARLRAGLTQEKLSDGICSALSLSRIENGNAGVSPATFQALMARAGIFCDAFPSFANRADFDCFYTLKHARFSLDAWQFQEVIDDLEKVEQKNWANNCFYEQEWLYLHYQILFHSQYSNHQILYDMLMKAIHISYVHFSIENLQTYFLSILELELVIALSQELLYLNKLEVYNLLNSKIEKYILNSHLTDIEKERLFAQQAIISVKYFIGKKEYEKALSLADMHRHQMVVNSENSLIYELTFLTALGYYFTKDTIKFRSLFRSIFYASHAIGSCYATTCKDYVENILQISIDEDIRKLSNITYTITYTKKFENTTNLNNGIFEYDAKNAMYLGDLIRELRMEQKLSQPNLCLGLCSPSKLSKIENNVLQPDIILAEALLQRLGISERIFTFWGSKKEQIINENKARLLHPSRNSVQQNQTYLKNIEQLISPKATLQYQLFLSMKIHFCKNTTEKFNLIEEALHLTLPDIKLTNINHMRFSWIELTLLNIYCLSLAEDKLYNKSNFYRYHIISYFLNNTSDDIFQKSVFAVTVSHMIRSLYLQKQYQELLEFKEYFKYSFIKQSSSYLGNCFFFYCQALGELGLIEEATLYGYYTCGIESSLELNHSSQAIQKSLFDDFGITLT